MKNILYLILLLFPLLTQAQITQERQVQSLGSSIESTTGTYTHTVIIGEPLNSGIINHDVFGGSTIGFLSDNLVQAVTAHAGANQSVLSGATVQLDGTASSGNDLTFQWISLDGLTLVNASSAQPTFIVPNTPISKTYQFELTVSDGQLTDTDIVEITVSSEEWSVTPLSNTGTLVAKVQVNGNTANLGDIVGIFSNGTARGVQEVILNDGEAFISLLVQLESTETVNFKVYDVSEDKICDVAATLSITPGMTIGSPNNPHLINATCGTNPEACQTTRTLNQEPITAATYQASETITSKGTIAPSTTVNFEAGQSITLFAGFHAKAGSSFAAIIKECQVSITTPIAEERARVPIKPKINAELQLKIQPNPFNRLTTIRLNLPANTPKTLLQIFDTSYRLLKSVSISDLEKGWNDFELNAAELEEGLYILAVQTTNEFITKKIVVVN